MKIIVVSENSEKICEGLNSVIPGNRLQSFNSVNELYNFVNNSTIIADILFISDAAVSKDKNDFNSGFSYLADVFEHRFFKVDKIIFLNYIQNEEFKLRYEFLIDNILKKFNIYSLIKSQSDFTLIDLKDIIKMSNKEFNKIKVNDIAVVQIHRNEEIITGDVINPEDTDVTSVSVIPKFDRKNITNLYKNNTEELNLDNELDINIENMESLEFEKLQSSVEIRQDDKYIAVTGVGNSGVTSTTLVLGYSASEFGKVLLVDLDSANMGLSFLVETFINNGENITNLNLELLLTDDIKSLETHALSSNNIHALTLTLPFIKHIENPEFIICNILNYLESRYDYIIFDVPLLLVNKYPFILGGKVDRFVITNLPYINKTVNTLRQIKNSNIMVHKAFKDGKVCIFTIGMPDRNGLPIIDRKIFSDYCTDILGVSIPCSGVFSLRDKGYKNPTFFQDIIKSNINKDDLNIIEYRNNDDMNKVILDILNNMSDMKN